MNYYKIKLVLRLEKREIMIILASFKIEPARMSGAYQSLAMQRPGFVLFFYLVENLGAKTIDS